jgi:hypothetical protein
MKPFSIAISTLGILAILVPAPARAQQFDLAPGLTKAEFKDFTVELGSLLRFRQFGDAETLGRRRVDLSVQFAGTPIDDSTQTWNNSAIPGVVARFGVSDRVDLGAWGRYDSRSNYGVAGVDTRIALLTQGPGRPVSVTIRPSLTSLIGRSEVWAANASIDLSISRTVGHLSPYVGVATTGSVALERSNDLDLDPAFAERSLAYAGLSYRWRTLSLSAEVEKAAVVSYGVRIGTRF